jgi:uncharacterized membrane protein YbaN (DUF454 family)
MKKYLWSIAGIISLGMAYVGFVLPGIPFSVFLVFSAFCFSKSSKRMHNWLYNHKHFGPFLTNWTVHKVFPLKMKYMMLAVMSSSLAILWFTTYNWKAVVGTGIAMAAVAIWTWRYPSTIEESMKARNGGRQ